MVQKCEACKTKKVSTLVAFSCRCGYKYLCDKCRYPDEHKCTFDYRKMAQDQLNKENPKIEGIKVEKI